MKHFLKIFYVVILISNITFAQTQLDYNNKVNNIYLKANKGLTTVYNKVLKEDKAEVEFTKNFK